MSSEKNMLYWHMSGKYFSPRHIQATTELEFNYQHEKGDIIRLNNGEILTMDSGAASLKIELDEAVNWDDCMHNFLSLLEDWHNDLLLNGLESLLFQIDILYKDQGNIALDSSTLKRLSCLNAALAVSAYKV